MHKQSGRWAVALGLALGGSVAGAAVYTGPQAVVYIGDTWCSGGYCGGGHRGGL